MQLYLRIDSTASLHTVWDNLAKSIRFHLKILKGRQAIGQVTQLDNFQEI